LPTAIGRQSRLHLVRAAVHGVYAGLGVHAERRLGRTRHPPHLRRHRRRWAEHHLDSLCSGFVPAKQRGLLSGLASVFIPFGLFSAPSRRWPSARIGACSSRWAASHPVAALAARCAGIAPLPAVARPYRRGPPTRSLLGLEFRGPDRQLAEMSTEQSASYSVIFSKYLEVARHHHHRSSASSSARPSFQSWGQSILGSGYKFSPSMVGALFMLVSLGDLSPVCRPPGSPIASAGAGRCSATASSAPWA